MKNNIFVKELSKLKSEKKRVLRVLNSMYFTNPKMRNEQFKKLQLIEREIKRAEFKVKLLKEAKNVKNNDTTRA